MCHTLKNLAALQMNHTGSWCGADMSVIQTTESGSKSSIEEGNIETLSANHYLLREAWSASPWASPRGKRAWLVGEEGLGKERQRVVPWTSQHPHCPSCGRNRYQPWITEKQASRYERKANSPSFTGRPLSKNWPKKALLLSEDTFSLVTFFSATVLIKQEVCNLAKKSE